VVALLCVALKAQLAGEFPWLWLVDEAVEVAAEGEFGRVRVRTMGRAQFGLMKGSTSQTFWMSSRHCLRGIRGMALRGSSMISMVSPGCETGAGVWLSGWGLEGIA
jgi:hypothetical protein